MRSRKGLRWLGGVASCGLSCGGGDIEVRKTTEEFIAFTCCGAECHVSLYYLCVVPLLRFVVEESVRCSARYLVGRGLTTSVQYLLSPLDGRPIDSRGSWLIGFKRLHGTEVDRPPRVVAISAGLSSSLVGL